MCPAGDAQTGVGAEPVRRGSAAERIRDGYRQVGLLSDVLLDDFLKRRADSQPDTLFISDSTGPRSYGEVYADAMAVASSLIELGVRPGDVVSFQLPNCVEAAITYFAALAVGAIVNPIVPIYREREIGFVLRQARPTVVVIPDSYRGVDYPSMHERASGDAGHLPARIVVRSDGGDGSGTAMDWRTAVAHAPSRSVVGRSGADRAVLLYTSGTTADPKGVLHSHQSLHAECRSMIDLCGLVGSDIIFMASPVTHITGLLYGVQMPAMIGASSIFQETWQPVEADRLIRDEGCTFTVGATPFLHGIIEAQKPGASAGPLPLRSFVCGGADVPPDLVLRAKDRLGVDVVRAYGLSELPTVTCGSLADLPDRRSRTDGRPQSGTRVRVRGSDGETCRVGSGELEASSPELFLGYVDKSLDDLAFTEDGWFRTGDLATLDDDGYVTILGRIKDVIVRGGENISAKEVEDVLFEHPAVTEIAVVGYPDPAMGERMCAFIVPAIGTAPVPGDLVSFLDQRGFARQKAPERVVLIDALPKTPSGKVQKHRLRRMLESPTESEGTAQ